MAYSRRERRALRAHHFRQQRTKRPAGVSWHCARKVRYLSRPLAERECRYLQRKVPTCVMTVYACRECDGFHVGKRLGQRIPPRAGKQGRGYVRDKSTTRRLFYGTLDETDDALWDDESDRVP